MKIYDCDNNNDVDDDDDDDDDGNDVFDDIRDLKILWTRPRRTSTGSEMFNSWN